MDDMHFSSDINGWARACCAEIPDELLYYFESLRGTSVFVGFSLPRAMGDVLTRLQIPFLNLELSPLRFCREMLLSASTNHASIDLALSALAVPATYFYEEASRMRATFALHREFFIGDDPSVSYGVFAGQMDSDLALINSGRITVIEDHLDEVKTVFAECDEIIFAPHPYNSTMSSYHTLKSYFPRLSISVEGTYKLLCMDNVKVVSALSSSIVTEARFFEKPAVRLIHPDAMLSDSVHHVGANINSHAFWNAILNPGAPGVTRGSEIPSSVDSIFQMNYGRR
jgi:hypothetical protein